MFDHEQSPRVVYAGYCYVRVCPKCNRFVKADPFVLFRGPFDEQIPVREPNATCHVHGRVEMFGEGWIE